MRKKLRRRPFVVHDCLQAAKGLIHLIDEGGLDLFPCKDRERVKTSEGSLMCIRRISDFCHFAVHFVHFFSRSMTYPTRVLVGFFLECSVFKYCRPTEALNLSWRGSQQSRM